MTGLLIDQSFTEHDPGDHHPEAPGRIEAINARLGEDGLVDRCQPIALRDATDDEILLVHTAPYLELVRKEVDGIRSGMLSTGDTQFSPRSQVIARQAAGSLLNAVDGVMTGELTNAFCAVRPPGHHATPGCGMGFCLFNSAAIAARYAGTRHGADRVAIVDWDVHHGNGTQDIFYEDGSVFFFSTHQHPWYPGTGSALETGNGAGKKTTLNAPLPAGSGMKEIGAAFREDFLKRMKDYKPNLIIISAGFDSRAGDPLGDFTLTDPQFVELTRILAEIAGEFAESRLVSVLEGGYNQSGLASAVSSHVETLIELSKP